jgi:hypothetical protein
MLPAAQPSVDWGPSSAPSGPERIREASREAVNVADLLAGRKDATDGA